MKYVNKPPALDIKPVPFTICDFIRFLVATDKRFNESGPGIRAGIRIEDVCDKCETKHYIELQNEHWDLLFAASEEPSRGYPRFVTTDGKKTEVAVVRELLLFIDAIRDARDEPPEAPTEE